MLNQLILAIFTIYEQIINEKNAPTPISTPPITLGAGKITITWTPN